MNSLLHSNVRLPVSLPTSYSGRRRGKIRGRAWLPDFVRFSNSPCLLTHFRVCNVRFMAGCVGTPSGLPGYLALGRPTLRNPSPILAWPASVTVPYPARSLIMQHPFGTISQPIHPCSDGTRHLFLVQPGIPSDRCPGKRLPPAGRRPSLGEPGGQRAWRCLRLSDRDGQGHVGGLSGGTSGVIRLR